MSNQLMTMKSGGNLSPILPQNIEEVFRLAQLCAKSGMAPASFKGNDAAITVAIMTGMELGVAPMQALQGIAIINGKPCVWGDLAMAIVQASDCCEYIKEWREGEGEALTAYCEVKRKDRPEATTQSFSITDAKQAQLFNKQGPWKTYPQRMLQMRARSWALRDEFSDVLKGLRVAEEEQDIEKNVVANISPPPAPTIEYNTQVDEEQFKIEPPEFNEDEYMAAIEEQFRKCKNRGEIKEILDGHPKQDCSDDVNAEVLALFDDYWKDLPEEQIDLEDAIAEAV